MSKYSEFKNLLKKFVEQANIKMKNGKGTPAKLGSYGFENNNYKKDQHSEEVTIDDISYKIQMFSSGHWGPKSGNGSQKLPYFGYELNSEKNIWINVRAEFRDYRVELLKIVKWSPKGKGSGGIDKDTEYRYAVDELRLNFDEEPNLELKNFYDQFISFKKGSKMKKEQNVVEEPSSNYIGDSKYAQVLKNSKNLIFRGAPGTGKTYLARQIAEELTGGNEEQIGFVQFHPSYDYTDFVEGLRPVSDKGQIGFKLQDGIFKKFCKKAKENPNKKFVFTIDEINRGEISKIFGELFFSIDPDYRGKDGKVTTQYANLRETDKEFYIPENVYIIGTMNDIDRSVDTFDFAMRRRFRFVEIKAADTMGMWENNDKFDNDKIEEARIRLTNLNRVISNTEGLNSHYHIGPSYFLKLKDLDYDYDILWSDYLEPLLKDYLRGSYDETDSLDKLKDAYNNEEETDEG
ncbi:McrB family protein [Streptococcus mutans]|uniref:McrB family protein n=1 Tax=Streptococcus mutans TaxID=1309 RepID=UPI0002B5A95A|nr:AAA family ATPase [Streptococcus mutans]EMB90562.1 putative endonuclease [Streptococcus mutans A19]EMB94346.1 putative endonuclease [Streptococcus mutans U138]